MESVHLVDPNNQTSQTTPRGYVSNYGYDGRNRVTSVTPPAVGGTASPATTYTYDKYGNLVTKTNGRGNAWTYLYNTKHQISEILDPLGRSRTYAYTSEGDLAGYFGGRAHAPGADASNFYVYPVHDEYHRLVGIVTPDNESTSWYDYDADGNLDSTSDDILGTANYTHDAAEQLTKVDQSAGTFTYTYDPTGHVATRDYQYGSKLTYHYNSDGLADQVTEDDHHNTPTTTSFGYDADQTLTTITYPATTGMVETRTYTAAEQLATIQTKNPTAPTPLSKYTYTRDADGNPTQIATTRGSSTTNAAYTYDTWDRLNGWCPGVTTCTSAVNRVDYGYDPASNLTTENRQGAVLTPGAITNTYDTADQLTTRATTVSGTTTTGTYTYDYDGNLTTGARTWNLLNQMTASNMTGTGATTYTYDALNNRRTATTGTGASTQTRSVLWDTNNPLPMPALVVEPNYDTTTEVYAPDTTLLESRHLYRAYDADYYAHDDRGSITDAFKPTGTATWANTYDPWGTQTTHTPLTSDAINNYFGYTGAYTEPTTGELSLRARDFNATLQRFASVDPLSPPGTRPLTSAYSYAGNQPTFYTDPSGQCFGIVCDVIDAVTSSVADVTSQLATQLYSDPFGSALQYGVGIGGGAVSLFDYSNDGRALASAFGAPTLSSAYYGGTSSTLGVDGTEPWANAGEVAFDIGLAAGTFGFGGAAACDVLPEALEATEATTNLVGAANAGAQGARATLADVNALVPEGQTLGTWGSQIWGRGAEGAKSLIGSRGADELAQIPGLNVQSATVLRNFYQGAVEAGKGGTTAPVRVQLLDDIITRMGG